MAAAGNHEGIMRLSLDLSLPKCVEKAELEVADAVCCGARGAIARSNDGK